MNTTKTTLIALAIAAAGLSSTMAAPPTKSNYAAQKAWKERVEQRQEQKAMQMEGKKISTIGLFVEEKPVKTRSFHRRFKHGIVSK